MEEESRSFGGGGGFRLYMALLSAQRTRLAALGGVLDVAEVKIR